MITYNITSLIEDISQGADVQNFGFENISRRLFKKFI